MKKYTFILSTLFFLLLSACDGDKIQQADDQIPNVPVNFSILTNNMLYGDLEMRGHWVYLNGGYKGILVYHGYDDEYYAFERCCTYDARITDARVWVTENGSMLYDSICGSTYFIQDGSPTVEGPATQSLRRYNTAYNPGDHVLHIWY